MFPARVMLAAAFAIVAITDPLAYAGGQEHEDHERLGGYYLGSRFNVNTKAKQVGPNMTQQGALAGLELSF